jgi:hypothetical protein
VRSALADGCAQRHFRRMTAPHGPPGAPQDLTGDSVVGRRTRAQRWANSTPLRTHRSASCSRATLQVDGVPDDLLRQRLLPLPGAMALTGD